MRNSEKKIIQINSSSDFGGGPQVMWEIVNGLKNLFSFVIIAPKGPFLEKYHQAGIKVYTLPIRSYNPFLIFEIRRILKKEKPDLIHTHGKGAGIWGRLATRHSKISVIHTPHGLHYRKYHKFLRFFYFILERWLSKQTVKIVNVSKSEKNEALELKLYPSEKSIVIPNGINVEFFLKFKSSFSQNALINIGRLNSQKNQKELIEIMRYLPEDITLEIIGEGQEREKIEGLIKKYNLENRIELIGALPREEALNHLRKSKIYISTSLWEGLPLTLLEAGIIGIPIVATKVTGNIDIIEDGKTGFFYDSGNPKQAAEKIKKLLGNEKLYQQISENTKEKIRREFSLDQMLKEYQNLYQSIT